MNKGKRIRIPDEVYTAIRDHLHQLSAGSVDEYVESVLRDNLKAAGILSAYSPEEEKEVERRLRDLGYLD
ncbi:MAG: CopG family transcriptional regulator [Candidatus Bipolaricaulaceae bacterium]